MGQYVEAFTLGNAAILGNVCLLPLYPGLFALLAARTEGADDERSVRLPNLSTTTTSRVCFPAGNAEKR